MSADLVAQLRQDAQAQRDGAPAGAALWVADRFDQAADEIASLREAIRRLADQDATLSVQGGNVIVEMDATLTDAEREAVEATIVDLDGGANFNEQRFWPMLAKRLRERSATLRGLLERLGGGR